MKDVTFGKLVNLTKTDTLYIPAQWVKNFNDENNKYAIFLKNNPTMFRFIPTKTNNVVQFHMKLTVLEENFLQNLFHIFEVVNKEYNIKPIYSSGVCFISEMCYYLFLIEYVDEKIEKDIKDMLVKLSGVEEVIIEKYNIK